MGQIFTSEKRVPHLNALAGGWSRTNIAINDTSLKLDSLAYISAEGSIGISSTTFP